MDVKQQGLMIRVLYISYDGMTDPLGQSQVIPYLKGLSQLGYHFTLLSFEKQEKFKKSESEVRQLLNTHGIEWIPLSYTKRPPILSTLYDLWRMKRKAFSLYKTRKFRIVHCRSYISAMVGLQMQKKLSAKFLFDMRGFYADERVEGGIWNLNNPLFRMVYKFFKRKEAEFFGEADYSICLTENGKREIHTWSSVKNQPVPIEVIPCCADLEKFSPKNVDPIALDELRRRLGIGKDDFVLSYLGSIGTWYMPEEMLDFYKVLLEKEPKAKFLFITADDKEIIYGLAKSRGVSLDGIIVVSAAHKDVPLYLALSSWSIFFIKPVYSKKASSPTKQGEIMGMGIPHICNSGVGDVDEILKNGRSGVIVDTFDREGYDRAALKVLNGHFLPEEIQNSAATYYSLKEGVGRYLSVYKQMAE